MRHIENMVHTSATSENYKLTHELEQLGTDYNNQVSLVGWHEEQEEEYKRLLKATTSDIHDMLTERFGVICEFCKWYDSKNADCAKPRNGSGAWCCEYGCSRYAYEVKELIGDEKNGTQRGNDNS